jgi:hypothetical protein
VKRVIDLLEETLDRISCVAGADRKERKLVREGERLINEAVDLLIMPCWYTPDRWKDLTGKEWQDKAAVYYRCSRADTWVILSFEEAKRDIVMSLIPSADIICATEAGIPPNDWKLEEAE